MLTAGLGNPFRGAHRVWTLLEEGGEMATLSLTCAAAVAAAWRREDRLRRLAASAGYRRDQEPDRLDALRDKEERTDRRSA